MAYTALIAYSDDIKTMLLAWQPYSIFPRRTVELLNFSENGPDKRVYENQTLFLQFGSSKLKLTFQTCWNVTTKLMPVIYLIMKSYLMTESTKNIIKCCFKHVRYQKFCRLEMIQQLAEIKSFKISSCRQKILLKRLFQNKFKELDSI